MGLVHRIVAVDFDGTLCENCFPDCGKEIKVNYKLKNGEIISVTLIDILRFLQVNGHQLILFTCRQGEALINAVKWCKERHLEFDAVNDDVEATYLWYAPTEQDKANLSAKRKIFAHVYIDDRNLGVSKVFKNGITLDDELISELGIPFGEGEKFMKKVVSLYA